MANPNVGAPNTGSTLTYASGINRTSTAISTNIIILVNDRAVGAVQTLSIKEARAIRQIDEVGTDGHVDSVPHQSTNITGTCNRVRFDRLRITEAFSRGFVHAASQVYPFDIVILDKQKAAVGNQISTVIKNVWIGGLDYQYQATDWVITDNMTWEAERIFSVLSNGSAPNGLGGGAPVAQGGEIGVIHMGMGANSIQIASTNIEQLADTGFGGQGGSLDISGIIDIGNAGAPYPF